MQVISDVTNVLVSRGFDEANAKLIAEKYIAAILCELTKQMAHDKNNLSQQFPCSIMKIRKDAGQMRIDGKRIWTYNYLSKNADTRILNIASAGFTKRLSKVEINPTYIGEILSVLYGTAVNNTVPEIKEEKEITILPSNEFHVSVPIDMKSLRNFIEYSTQTLTKRNISDALVRTINDEMSEAINLLNIANNYEEVSRNKKIIVETWRECDNGRIYGLGKSIQSMNSRVREAALGACYRYDFKACSYGVLASLARQIDPTIKVGFIKEYVRNRQQIRAAIAKDINLPEKKVKNIFTAMGFGAHLTTNKYHAMSKMINKEELLELTKSRRFADIYTQLEDCKQIILNYEDFKGDFDLAGKLFIERDEQNKKKNNNQRLAFIYQRFERLMLDMVCDTLPEDVVLLKVHDCVYTKRKILQNEMENIQSSVAKIIDIFGIEEKKVEPYGLNFLKPEIRSELKDHDSRIMEEEMIAKLWATQRLTNPD